ncbi:hypothetical protein ACIQPP_13935 [Streptomyces violaceusniger]|uniref:hypothetical protein n=1 Tax=Streptomyces violaceusniger TaxID=68280 RepID=UPI00099610F5|nr:hypothetical protein [Streptomyces hygroscopicus]AQW51783.1 hypothetical protein SHXM_05246 [Streptomyces hygroscopicus]
MTDTTITAVVAPEAAPDSSPPPQAPEQPTASPAAAEVVDHTPGGWPVVPLAVTGTNTTASLLGAAALVGGPAALALAATGAVVIGTAAATRSRRDQRRNARAGRAARHGAAGRVPRQKRPSSLSKGSGAGRASGVAGGKSGGRGKAPRHEAGSTALGRAGSLRRKARTASDGAGTAAGKVRGRTGQVRALRESARQASGSRAARRAQTTGARRSVADARRGANAAGRFASQTRRGPIGRAVGRGAGRVGRARGAAIERSRAARDRRAAGQVAGQRDAVRRAPARRRARQALRRSAARFQGRRLLAAVLAGALGLVGLVSTLLGRRLGWAWLQYPGRRLYARLMHAAEEERAARDEAIRAVQEEEEAAVDAEAAGEEEQVGDTAERPTRPTPAAPTTTPSSEGENVSGFRFEEYAAEMESAAQQYDPDNAMEILAMVEGLPAALTSVANVMRILAERADTEFPLEKEVADGFNDIFGAVMSSVAVAEDMGPLFRTAHEQDIARHEDPRNGPEAEKGWNV